MKFNWLIRIMAVLLAAFTLFVIFFNESTNMYIYLAFALIVFGIAAYILGQFVKRDFQNLKPPWK